MKRIVHAGLDAVQGVKDNVVVVLYKWRERSSLRCLKRSSVGANATTGRSVTMRSIVDNVVVVLFAKRVC